MKPENEKKNDGSPVVHVYDDIEEQDNQLPRWWLMTFYLSIAFAIPYFAYYGLGFGPTLSEEWRKEQHEVELAELSKKSNAPQIDETSLDKLASDPVYQKKGAGVFSSKCVSCHGTKGEGGIGPNLTDDAWLHGAKLTEITHTVREGVLDKGMPPWKSVLSDEEVTQVVAFIRSIRGSNPPNAKAPQGQVYKQ